MFNISDFLEKFKKFDQNKTFQTEVIIKGIESVVGVKIDKKAISLKNGILRIQGSPVLHQEIFLKKDLILPVIAAAGVLDIR